MAQVTSEQQYHATESKYKGGAQEMYVTYDLMQETRGENRVLYPKVKRVYIAGDVTHWEIGTFEKRSGRQVYGVRIDYEQRRSGYTRRSYTARRGSTEYQVPETKVEGSTSRFSVIVEVPENAENVQFRRDQLPAKYSSALQDIR
ncbi:MAG: hypothetical protein IT319_00970 [Anaerolineae bacterium]|nr:hypothetical protein [Anaerolineae bacterium]